MADEQPKSITMYRNGEARQVSPKLYKTAIEKGWSRTPPQQAQSAKPPAQAGAPQPSGGAGAGGFAGAGAATPSSGGVSNFMTGLGHGLNPFHSAPAGLPGMAGGQGSASRIVGDAGADMLNARESKDLFEHGHKAEGTGLAVGTGVGLAGSDIIKGVGEGLKSTRLGTEALTRASMLKAKALQKAVGGTIQDARLAEGVIQPIRESINKLFEPLHAALEGEKIALSSTAKQKIINIARNEPDIAKEITDLYRETGRSTTDAAVSSQMRTTTAKAGAGVKDVGKVGKTTRDTIKDTRYAVRPDLDYRSADKLVTRLRKLERESPQAGKLADEIEKGIDSVAKSKGKGTERLQLKRWYKQMSDIEGRAAGDINRSLARKLLRETKYGRKLLQDKPEIGKDTVAAAEALMSEITGKAKRDVLDKIGTITAEAAKRYKQISLAYRAGVSALTSDAPEQPVASK